MPLLALPFGTGSFLGHLLSRLEALPERVPGGVLVLPRFPVPGDYAQRIRDAGRQAACPVDARQLSERLDACEAGDCLLAVDAQRFPALDADFRALLNGRLDHRSVTHWVAVGAHTDQARERVECDEDGGIRRIERLYPKAAWPEVATTGIFLTFAPARLVRGVEVGSLAALRTALSSRGALSQDVALPGESGDLTEPPAVLSLNEELIGRQIRHRRTPGYVLQGPDVLVSVRARVHPAARLIGPLIIQEGASVAEQATVVGPSVLGAGSRVQRAAVVAQSVLAAGSVVAPRSTLRGRVASGHCLACAGPTGGAPDTPRLRLTPLEGRGRAKRWPSERVPRAGRALDRAAKRTLDFALAAASLVVLSPLLAVVAVLIKLESRGPVFFVHWREQRGGREFPCLKFRTMVADAHQRQRELYKDNEVDGPQFKLNRDPRVTALGKWLRATNLDELPQLINVLLGHMSLVGPRPSPFRENQICVPWRRARLSVRPGITGLWQICRSEDRSAGDFHEWVYYDVAYVRHFSFWLDFKILVATVLTSGGRWSVPASWILPRRRPAALPSGGEVSMA